MIINSQQPNVEVMEGLDTKSFAIDDTRMVFDILRSKMYSDPISSICREVACNARDAHREVGKFDLPIQITLPTHVEPFFKIKDWGPGISPDRMENVFIRYTASTKRNDNSQTGGYGCGSKTPFSYTDTFTVVTNYNGTQYNYCCFIDSTKIGKLLLLSDSPTKEPNGTEIIVPVNNQDFSSFSAGTELATRHFEVKPNIINQNFEYKKFQKLLTSGADWALCVDKNYNYDKYKLIVDGVEYPLNEGLLKSYYSNPIIYSGVLLLYFDTGEITLSSSREQVYLDDQTKEKIKNKLDLVKKEILEQIQIKINDQENLWKAKLEALEIKKIFSHSTDFLKNIKYKDSFIFENLHSSSYVNCQVFNFINEGYRIKRQVSTHIQYNKNSQLALNDLNIKNVTLRHVKKLFEDLNCTQIQVICPSNTISEEKLNELISLDQLNVKRFSSFVKSKPRKSNSELKQKLIVFKYNNNFSRTTFSAAEEDTNIKVLCFLDKNKDIILNNKLYEDRSLGKLSRLIPNVSFYGVSDDIADDRIEEAFDDFYLLDDFIQDKLSECNINFAKIKVGLNKSSKDSIFSIIENDLSMIKNPNSLFLQKSKILENLKYSDEEYLWLSLYESVNDQINIEEYLLNNPEFDIDRINKKIDELYSLLKNLNTYYTISSLNILNYINMVDKNMEENDENHY